MRAPEVGEIRIRELTVLRCEEVPLTSLGNSQH